VPPAHPPADPAKRPVCGVVTLALLPVGCCELPPLVTAVGSASVGAFVGGGTGLVLVVLAAAALTVRRRRRCQIPESREQPAHPFVHLLERPPR